MCHDRSIPIWCRVSLALSLLALVALSATMSPPAPNEALAANAKQALPTIRKHVNTGDGFDESGDSAAGARIRYRMEITVPEDIAECDYLEYAIIDAPDPPISPNTPIKARVVNSRGDLKSTIATTCSRGKRTFTIDLGNVKSACRNLAFGDRIVVEYPATISPSAVSGTYRNIARLVYDKGNGTRDSAEVMAIVTIARKDAPASSLRQSMPKTGDSSLAFAFAAAATATYALCAAIFAKRSRRS